MVTIKTYEYIIDDCAGRDPELARCTADEICTSAVNLLWLCECAGERVQESRRYLLGHIRRLLPQYLSTAHYGPGRKLKAGLAAVNPRIFTYIKNVMHKRLS